MPFQDKYVLMSLAILCIVSIWHAAVTLIPSPTDDLPSADANNTGSQIISLGLKPIDSGQEDKSSERLKLSVDGMQISSKLPSKTLKTEALAGTKVLPKLPASEVTSVVTPDMATADRLTKGLAGRLPVLVGTTTLSTNRTSADKTPKVPSWQEFFEQETGGLFNKQVDRGDSFL
ncbi:unnamed protein product [Protopolystoma xenopodis]|uniref:Uncharacterized protein n=1 Tax=Protopolystoma xenopodis TaxID=117903 RepID=A0A3S5A8D1_9PLAT|nr:unnamed protein product [Protopolystoma xenopodis]